MIFYLNCIRIKNTLVKFSILEVNLLSSSVDPRELHQLIRSYEKCKFILSQAIEKDSDILKTYYSSETKRLKKEIFIRYGIVVD